MEELARRSGLPGIDSRRFRMLVEFSGGDPYVEDSWNGTRLEVGEAVLRGGDRVKRCAATTRDPESGAVDLQTLRLIMASRGRQTSALGVGAHLGVYGTVVEPGTIRVGDRVRVRTEA